MGETFDQNSFCDVYWVENMKTFETVINDELTQLITHNMKQ